MAKCEPKAQYERIPSPLPEISLLRNASNQSLQSASKIQDHINGETKKINELELKYMDFNDRELLKQVLVKCKYLKDSDGKKSNIN